MDRRYNNYNSYLKEKFGCRVHKVSVDVGFTCPNRDGNVAIGGCIYCNNDSFVPSYAKSRVSLQDQIRTGMEYQKKRFKAEKFIIYFQAYTNTYDKIEKLEKLYREALDSENVVGLAIGTRSDCVEEEMIQMADEVSRLNIDFLKVHNLHIVKNTPLARMYAKDPFHLFNYQEYLDFITCFLERLAPNIVIERLFTDTPHDLLIAPRWNKTHTEILRGIDMELERRDTYQGRLFKEQSYT